MGTAAGARRRRCAGRSETCRRPEAQALPERDARPGQQRERDREASSAESHCCEQSVTSRTGIYHRPIPPFRLPSRLAREVRTPRFSCKRSAGSHAPDPVSHPAPAHCAEALVGARGGGRHRGPSSPALALASARSQRQLAVGGGVAVSAAGAGWVLEGRVVLRAANVPIYAYGVMLGALARRRAGT